MGRPARDKSAFPEASWNISITTLVYEPTLWHPNQDSPEDDVEGGGVLKENLEAEEGEQLQLTSQFSIDPIRGQKQEDQAMQGTKDAWKNATNTDAKKWKKSRTHRTKHARYCRTGCGKKITLKDFCNSPLKIRQRARLALNKVFSTFPYKYNKMNL